jgi:hypothetical protein
MSRAVFACVFAFAATAFAEDKKPEPKGEPVSGKGALEGKPLSGVVITFISKDGKTSVSAPTDETGAYKATVPVGEYRITVVAVLKKGDPKTPPPKPSVAVPAVYGDPKTTPLTYEVKAGAQTFDIELKIK